MPIVMMIDPMIVVAAGVIMLMMVAVNVVMALSSCN